MVIAQFCDDIRQEIGNKYSLMGCYGDEMVIDKLPAVLPKLCAQIKVLTPADRPFIRLLVRATINGETAAEIEMPVPRIDEKVSEKARTSETGRLSMVAIMAISPLPITEPCKVRIEAETEDGIIKGSALSIRERTQEDAPLIPA